MLDNAIKFFAALLGLMLLGIGVCWLVVPTSGCSSYWYGSAAGCSRQQPDR